MMGSSIVSSRVLAQLLFVLLSIVCVPVIGQESGDIPDAKRIASKMTTPDRDVFLGLGLTARQQMSSLGKLFAATDIKFDQSHRETWRCNFSDATLRKWESVIARNGDFTFRAGRLSAAEDFRFAEKNGFGFGSGMREEIARSLLRKFDCLSAPFIVKGKLLREFLLSEDIEVLEMLPSEVVNGLAEEGIIFEWTTGTKKAIGKLVWMPDNDYLIRKVHIYVPTEDGLKEILEDAAVDYRLHEGRLLPCRVRRDYGPSRRQEVVVSEFRDAEEDRDYYTAESIGLEKPVGVFSGWLVFACLLMTAFAIAFAGIRYFLAAR